MLLSAETLEEVIGHLTTPGYCAVMEDCPWLIDECDERDAWKLLEFVTVVYDTDPYCAEALADVLGWDAENIENSYVVPFENNGRTACLVIE